MHYPYFIFFILLLTGCGAPRHSDFFVYHDNGLIKPKIVFLPIRTCEGASQEIIENLKLRILEHLCDQGELFVYTDEEVKSGLAHSSPQDSIEVLCANFKPADFVVEIELIDDGMVFAVDRAIPYLNRNPQERQIRLSLQIMDIRGNCPQRILFEVIEKRELLIASGNGRPYKSFIYDNIAAKTAERLEEIILWKTSRR